MAESGGLSGILPEPYQRGGNPLFAPYHPQTGVPLTEDDTELVRFGYCPTPALALFGHREKAIHSASASQLLIQMELSEPVRHV